MSQVASAIPDFWALFRQRAADLGETESADTAVYDELLERLHRIDPGLYLEYSVNAGASELIVTAEGDRSLFQLARSVVAAAPVIEGWTMHALKPQIGFPVSVRWGQVQLRMADVEFDPLEGESGELGLRMFVPGISDSDVNDAHNALLRALDHGLGEEAFAEKIQFTEVRLRPADQLAAELIPLTELSAFIKWREGELQRGAG
jgi:hypothetical protein